jgi:hypothetical protein
MTFGRSHQIVLSVKFKTLTHGLKTSLSRSFPINQSGEELIKYQTDITVAVYDRHTQAESSIKTLQKAGFDMKKISIIGKDYFIEENVIGYFDAGDRAKFFGEFGVF